MYSPLNNTTLFYPLLDNINKLKIDEQALVFNLSKYHERISVATEWILVPNVSEQFKYGYDENSFNVLESTFHSYICSCATPNLYFPLLGWGKIQQCATT